MASLTGYLSTFLCLCKDMHVCKGVCGVRNVQLNESLGEMWSYINIVFLQFIEIAML